MAHTESWPLAVDAERLRPLVDRALSAYTDFDQGCPEKLREAIRYSLLAPGKRMRPLLAVMAAEACGGPIDVALPVACAVEMIHAYSLIHDDLPAMDDDDLPRGRPTCHRVYGEAMAILAGDALLALAFQVVADGVTPPAVAAACCSALAEAAGPCHLVGGQADDMVGLAPGDGVKALESLHLRKTGAMIRVSLRLGALTAGATPEQLTALDRYGRAVGLAFQIADDLLDVCGDEAALGKRVGKDSPQGKSTFPGVLGVDASSARARQLVDDACRALDVFGPRADGLAALAHYVLERNR
jgi:geranylgeranyl diphosphate synthase, type II